MSIELRNYQTRGVADIRAAYGAGRKSVAFIAPTGSGKTIVLTYIAHGATAKGNRMAVIVHRAELIRQTSVALNSMDVRFGIVAPGVLPQPDMPVQLAMIQTLVNRPDAIQSPNLIIIDEAHHVLADSYLQIIARYPKAKILGLTATPQRLDGKGLGTVFEQLVMGPSVQELIDTGFLSRPKYYAPPTGLDMTGVKRTAGDFNKKQMGERVDRPTITGSAVEHYLKICPGVPAVAFCASVKHAEHVRDQFIAAGIPSAAIDGKLSDDERVDRVAALTDGRIKVLTSVDVISEGFDLPSVTAAILLRPTESLALSMQQIGRVLRPSPGKTFAFVLDCVGNCMRHGLAEEPREWNLAGRPRKSAATGFTQMSLSTCPKCAAVHVPANACPECGHAYPPRSRLIGEVDGQLAILTAQAVLAERERIRARQAIGQAKTKEQLEAIAKERGYKPTWVQMMLRSRMKKKWAEKVSEFHEATAQRALPI